LNIRNKKNATALLIAAAEGHAGVVQVLLQAGARRELKDEEGMMALDVAKKASRDDIVALLNA